MEKDKKNKTAETKIIQEAIADFNAIVEAAKKDAKNDLAKQLPEKFEELLKESMKKHNKELVNESDKDKNGESKEKLDENTDKKNESVITESTDMRSVNIEEVEQTFDKANSNDEFQTKENGISLDDIEAELAEMDMLSTQADQTQQAAQPAAPTPMAAQPGAPVAIPASPEVSETPAEDTGNPYDMLEKIYNEFGKYISDMKNKKLQEELGGQFDQQMSGIYGESFKESMGDEKYNELFEMFAARQNGEPFDKQTPMNETADGELPPPPDEINIDENADGELPPPPDEINIDENVNTEDVVDESHGVGITAQKGVNGDQLPRPEYADYKKAKLRYALQKEGFEKKMKGLLDENKKLTKENIRTKKSLVESVQQNKQYIGVLGKYRSQLSEMALFNTNLASINNILLSEGIALTVEEKQNMVNSFKGTKTIEESEKLYNTLLTEMKDGKKTITENIEDKVSNNTIESSSKQKLDESIVEKTAYSSNEHVDRLKRLMKYVDQK